MAFECLNWFKTPELVANRSHELGTQFLETNIFVIVCMYHCGHTTEMMFFKVMQAMDLSVQMIAGREKRR